MFRREFTPEEERAFQAQDRRLTTIARNIGLAASGLLYVNAYRIMIFGGRDFGDIGVNFALASLFGMASIYAHEDLQTRDLSTATHVGALDLPHEALITTNGQGENHG